MRCNEHLGLPFHIATFDVMMIHINSLSTKFRMQSASCTCGETNCQVRFQDMTW